MMSPSLPNMYVISTRGTLALKDFLTGLATMSTRSKVRGRQHGFLQAGKIGDSSYGLPFLAPVRPSCDLVTHIPSFIQLANSYRSTGTN